MQSARATLDVAIKEFDRQKQLFEKKYTSQAALERAEAQFKATQAQVSAQLAQAGAARAQSGFFVVKAPYGGVIAEVPIVLGDMAMPGRALLTMYDPGLAARYRSGSANGNRADRLGQAGEGPVPRHCRQNANGLHPSGMTLLPTADPATHTAQVRLDLPATAGNVAPGTFARVWLPMQGASTPRLYVPAERRRPPRRDDRRLRARCEGASHSAAGASGARASTTAWRY